PPALGRRAGDALVGTAAKSQSSPPHGHFSCEQQRSPCRSDRGNSLACDVVSCAVRRRADRKRKSTEKSHTAIETHQLPRDLALVVVHRQHCIERTAFGAKENGIRRERPFDKDAPALGCLHHWGDYVDLLAPEITAIAGVRVEASDCNPRTREAGAPHT